MWENLALLIQELLLSSSIFYPFFFRRRRKLEAPYKITLSTIWEITSLKAKRVVVPKKQTSQTNFTQSQVTRFPQTHQQQLRDWTMKSQKKKIPIGIRKPLKAIKTQQEWVDGNCKPLPPKREKKIWIKSQQQTCSAVARGNRNSNQSKKKKKTWPFITSSADTFYQQSQTPTTFRKCLEIPHRYQNTLIKPQKQKIFTLIQISRKTTS